MRAADWKQRAVELKKQGVSWTKLPEELEREYKKPFDYNKVRYAVRSHPWYKKQQGQDQAPQEPENIFETVMKSLKGGATRTALCDKTGISKRVLDATLDDIRDAGFLINDDGENVKLCRDVVPQDNSHECEWTGDRIIRFALITDNHCGSKYTQHTYLHHFYDLLNQEGIETVYHSGDMFEGEKMRPGHEYEIHIHGVDDNIDFAEKVYPQREGITTYFITGNHCHSFIKRSGCDVGTLLAARRKDMVYLGKSNATINLTPNCKLALFHPLDGSAYAISYKTQKMIDAMQGGEKPNILAAGHYHKSEYLPNYRNIHAFQTGTFQAQTPWMAGKQLAAMVGGWIVEAHVDDEGSVTRCKGEFIPYYKMIKDDWKNWT